MKAEHVNKIKSYLESHHNEMIDYLKALVEIETPSQSKNSQYEIFNLIADKLSHLGYYSIQPRKCDCICRDKGQGISKRT